MLVLLWKLAPIMAITKEERLLLVTCALVGTLLFGAVVVARVDRWRKRQMANDDQAPALELGSFRSMYERGELSKEEYDRILQKIAARAGAKAKAPPQPAPPMDSAPDQPPPTTAE